jgi:tRNA pseudouridine38-40 synthase
MKVKITLSYDGSQFQGFQAQRDGTSTVANHLENAFDALGIAPHFHGSGRTDSGVHATGQVIDIDLPVYWADLSSLKRRLNWYLTPSVSIHRIEEVDADFHARFSAKRRVYRYLVKSGRPSVFASSYCYYHAQDIDMPTIQAGMDCLLGVHDFASFSKRGSEPHSTVREIFSAKIYRYHDVLVFRFEADGYLRSQIRMMMAFLLKINDGDLGLEDLKMQLEEQVYRSRSLVPPSGLYLAKVLY